MGKYTATLPYNTNIWQIAVQCWYRATDARAEFFGKSAGYVRKAVGCAVRVRCDDQLRQVVTGDGFGFLLSFGRTGRGAAHLCADRGSEGCYVMCGFMRVGLLRD